MSISPRFNQARSPETTTEIRSKSEKESVFWREDAVGPRIISESHTGRKPPLVESDALLTRFSNTTSAACQGSVASYFKISKNWKRFGDRRPRFHSQKWHPFAAKPLRAARQNRHQGKRGTTAPAQQRGRSKPPLARRRLLRDLGLRDRERFGKAYLMPALESGLLERTIPDKTQSSKQRYR